MKKRLLIACVLTLAAVAIGGAAVAWAASSRQETPVAPPLTGNLAAMHGACASGNAEVIRAAIDNMTPEDWQAMAGQMTAHMSGGTGSMMGGGMMGSGSHAGMMSDNHSGTGGMMGPGSTGGMMGSSF